MKKAVAVNYKSVIKGIKAKLAKAKNPSLRKVLQAQLEAAEHVAEVKGWLKSA